MLPLAWLLSPAVGGGGLAEASELKSMTGVGSLFDELVRARACLRASRFVTEPREGFPGLCEGLPAAVAD